MGQPRRVAATDVFPDNQSLEMNDLQQTTPMLRAANPGRRVGEAVLAHIGEIETALALGADPALSVARYSQSTFESSLFCGDRFAAVAGHRVDSGIDGGHAAFGIASGVRGD
jgi:hypothetical protein